MIDPVFDTLDHSLDVIKEVYGDDGIIEEGLKDIENITKNCFVKIDVDDCGGAIEDGLFGNVCRVVKFKSGILLDTLQANDVATSDLGDVVASNNMYPALVRIFDKELNTPGFSDYVKHHVKFYRSEFSKLLGNSRAEERAVYFRTSKPSKALIMHELTHIWQYYTNGFVDFSNDYCEEVEEREAMPLYEFNLDKNLSLTDYGVEQQAQIVENYYMYSEGLRTGCGYDSNFLNCSAFSSNISDSLRSVVSSSKLNVAFSLANSGYPMGGTIVAEFNDPVLGDDYNNCSYKKTYGTGGGNYLYSEYEIACTSGIYQVGVEETFDLANEKARECKFHDIEKVGIYGSGSCSNWRVFEQ